MARKGEKMSAEMMTILLTTKQLAELLQYSEAHLARLRVEGGGPPFIKLGPGRQAKIRYRRTEVEKWLSEREFVSTSAAVE